MTRWPDKTHLLAVCLVQHFGHSQEVLLSCSHSGFASTNFRRSPNLHRTCVEWTCGSTRYDVYDGADRVVVSPTAALLHRDVQSVAVACQNCCLVIGFVDAKST